ncbi:glycoside hydrolase family 3 C-terminal domain-containing protein [Demequina sp.]|uniref:glycoside hydrolase family 3 C-terminal domain-containing protein n=1 Tax=Demequina sp. TaxID=2050685 RepID=UPI003D0D7B07
MRDTTAAAERIVAGLSLDDKIRLLSGKDLWTTEEAPGAPSIMVTDGPHGLRKQLATGDTLELGKSAPATCFPTAAALGSSWDTELLEEVGEALGRECRAENVGVLLGPGLNLKRHAAGGRTFEYFSEDPFLSGHMAAALVKGVQSQGVGTSIKHYVANNQEHRRMTIDTIIDERTFRELYLTGFEIAVRESKPWTIMSSYNLVNGEHVGESRTLMTTILREEFGFDGLAMTDWGATYDRPAAVHAGLDLEMPGSNGSWDEAVKDAVASGTLSEADVDLAAVRVLDMALRAQVPDAGPADFDAHHALARRAAAAGSVLLTNDGILPLKPKGTIAVIGAFAEAPRYQGAGSSLVTATKVDAFLPLFRDALGAKATVTYAPGYDARTGAATKEQLDEARAAASGADTVVLLVGLPSALESEGFDRTTLRLPDGHEALIAAVTEANPKTVVVMLNGGAVVTPWADKPAAILEAYLGGQAGGGAIADVLLGVAEPGGRLAESFPVAQQDVAADRNFPGGLTQVEYREGLYVGYRFHDSAGVPARFPFGHGLSYTSFGYSGLSARKSGDGYTVTVTVTNTGKRAGSEVVQLYVRDVESTVYRPAKELRAFAKVALAPGESQKVTLRLDRRAFAVWDVAAHAWLVEVGEFELLVGSSSVDIRERKIVKVASDDVLAPSAGPVDFVATDEEFAAMLGHAIPTARPVLPFTLDSTLGDLTISPVGRRVVAAVKKQVEKQFNLADAAPDDAQAGMFASILEELPVRGLSMMSDGKVSLTSAKRLVRILNLTTPKAWGKR